MLCQVKDLRPFPHMVSNFVEDETSALSNDEMYITVTKDEEGHSTDAESNQSSNGDNNEGHLARCHKSQHLLTEGRLPVRQGQIALTQLLTCVVFLFIHQTLNHGVREWDF